MYYRDKMIDGLWHFKLHPEGSWMPMSAGMLIAKEDGRKFVEAMGKDLGDCNHIPTDSLKSQLEKAVQREDYLEAAELRDKINAYK